MYKVIFTLIKKLRRILRMELYTYHYLAGDFIEKLQGYIIPVKEWFSEKNMPERRKIIPSGEMQ